MFVDTLKRLRELAGLNRKQLAEKLEIPYTTYYNYESGTREPNSDILIRLSKFFDVSIDYLLKNDEVENNDNLREEESLLIKKYRALDERGQKIVDYILDAESTRMEKPEADQNLEADNVIDFPLYMDAPSAGNGNDLGNGDYEIISVPDSLTARLASYAVRVNGKSMEPELMDGDVVLVKGQETFDKGNLVVFAKNGDGFIKLAGETCFESINPDYPDIHIGEDDSFHVFGIVVGKL